MGSKKSTNSNSGGGGRGDGRKETNRRRNEINPNVIKAGTKKVKKDIGFNQKKHPTEGIVDSYALKSKKGGTGMYGEEVSKATNEYLVSIGEAKKSKTGSYWLTSKGKKMKYGDHAVALGTGNRDTIAGSIPISEQMFESQKKLQGALIAGLSFTVPMVGGQIMRGIAADTMQGTYGGYRNKFNKNLKSDKAFKARNTGGNETANNETANLSMGTTEQDTNKKNKKKSTNKNTGRYFAGQYSDESTDKRTFYS